NGAKFLFEGYNEHYNPTPYFDTLYYPNTDSITGICTNPQYAVDVYRGTNLQSIWYREYNFGYGRKIMEKEDFIWYGGIGIKYIAGYGSYMYNQNGDELLGYTALSPVFDVDYDEPSPSLITKKGLKRVGDGMGFDIGFTFLVKEKIKIGVAVNDIGWITWNGNVYQGNNVKVERIESAGLDNYNIFAQGQLINADNAPGDPSMWTGLAKKTMSLPMNFRGGISWRIEPEVEVGFDSYIPLNKDIPGRYESSMFGLGCHYDPAKWVQLSAGMTTGSKIGFNIPFGVSFFPVRDKMAWELGFAVRDMISWFKQENVNVSAAFGFLRFSFGEKKGG
ncbi:MAG: DUF5723 family protein, partial [bacterium]